SPTEETAMRVLATWIMVGAIAACGGNSSKNDRADARYVPPPLGEGLGAYPFDSSPKTRGGTMTFTNVGAPGWWPRRIDRPMGDPACTYKDGLDTWGGHCCMKEQHTESTKLAPFDEEMTLIMKALILKQLAVYQPNADGAWDMVSSWDKRVGVGNNLAFTQRQ